MSPNDVIAHYAAERIQLMAEIQQLRVLLEEKEKKEG